MKPNFLRFCALWLDFLLLNKMQVCSESFLLSKAFATKLHKKLRLYCSLPYEAALTVSC